MARETASIMTGKRTTVVRSDAVTAGRWPTAVGAMMKNGPRKLSTRLLRASIPDAESQMTGKTARAASPGRSGAAPLRMRPMATKSRTGTSR
jgi:hypothetical protein